MTRPIVHLYCLCWNEAALIPFFLRHYDPLVSHFFVWDNNSTDGSQRLLNAHGRVTVTAFDVPGDSFVLEEQRLSETIWRQSRGVADWVAVLDMDEFLHHPALLHYLAHCGGTGVTALRAIGYEMVTTRFPSPSQPLPHQVTIGVRSLGHDKLCLFDPAAIVTSGFRLGRHDAVPTGRVVWPSRPAIGLLHYKHLGLDYARRRNRLLRTGLRSRDVAERWGHHYLREDAVIEADFDRLLQAARGVPGLRGGAPMNALAADETMIRHSGRFDAAWYLARYPDVAAAAADPVAHWHNHGWREGRRPCAEFDPGPYLANGPAIPCSDPDAANPFLAYFAAPSPASGTRAKAE